VRRKNVVEEKRNSCCLGGNVIRGHVGGIMKSVWWDVIFQNPISLEKEGKDMDEKGGTTSHRDFIRQINIYWYKKKYYPL